MLIPFSKYHGTGNDFVLIDSRNLNLQLSQNQVAHLCNRRFGIGADGLILLQMVERMPRMIYFNADGAEGSMCGNGGRCFVAFCQSLNILSEEGDFVAVDGRHAFTSLNGEVSLKMTDVDGIEQLEDDVFLDTGSPHYVRVTDNILELDVMKEGRAIRYNRRFEKEGTNVNFMEVMDGLIHIRTYERGVEDETLSCGTGATACAVAAHRAGLISGNEVPIKVLGGKLSVSFSSQKNGSYTNIWLTGPAQKVYTGTIEI